MLTPAELTDLGCPPALLDAVAKFQVLLAERIPANLLPFDLTHDDLGIELLDDTTTVLIDGLCGDYGGRCQEKAKALAAAILVESDPAVYRAWAKVQEVTP